jgi:hypothetical protein
MVKEGSVVPGALVYAQAECGVQDGMSRGTYKSLTNQSQKDPLVPLQWSNLGQMSH